MKKNMNLGVVSPFNVRFYRTSKKAHLELSNDLDEIIIGSMLGDLSAEKPGVKSNTRLQLLPEAKSKG